MPTGESRRTMILDAALTLFAQRGYDGVGVDEIGEAVGIKGPALYYYFKGKDALLDALVSQMTAYYEEHFGSASATGPLPDSMAALSAMSLARLAFTLHDERVRKVRRMLTIEQFRNERLSALATRHNLTGIAAMHTVIFRHLIGIGRCRPLDPEQLAFEFTAPVSLLVQIVDREPQKEDWAMDQIRRHLAHFEEIYGL